MRKFWLYLPLFLLLASAFQNSPVPIEVFAQYSRAEQAVTLYFANPVTGLSTPVSLSGFRADQIIVEQFSLLPDGVLFRNPRDGAVLVAGLDGAVRPHPFIPQQSENLADVRWVLTSDRQSILWSEVFPGENQWISRLYLADSGGTSIIELPTPPADLATLGRVLPLALTNDRSLVFVDAAAPMNIRGSTDYFEEYQDIQVYVANLQSYQHLPGEAGCLCAAGVGRDGRVFLRQNAEGLTLWDLNTNTQSPIPPSVPRFAQIGDIFFADGQAFYSLAENLDDDSITAQFALMRLDLSSATQQLIIPPSAQRFRVVAAQQDTAVLVDVYGGGTYKLDLRTGVLGLVAEQSWLGQLDGE